MWSRRNSGHFTRKRFPLSFLLLHSMLRDRSCIQDVEALLARSPIRDRQLFRDCRLGLLDGLLGSVARTPRSNLYPNMLSQHRPLKGLSTRGVGARIERVEVFISRSSCGDLETMSSWGRGIRETGPRLVDAEIEGFSWSRLSTAMMLRG